MSAREHRHDGVEGPELLPPPELLRLRRALGRPPSPVTRAAHLSAIGEVRRHASSPAGRLASRGARAAAAIVATLAVTSGLAAADVLPAPAQRIFSSVSDRFTARDTQPPARVTDAPADAAEPAADGGDGAAPAGAAPSGGPVEDPAVAAAPSSSSSTSTTTAPRSTTTTTAPPTTTTTIAGPTGPGTPGGTDGPTDPGTTDGGPTDPGTTDGGPTDPGTGGTDGGTDGAGSTDDTVGTTEVPPAVPTEDSVSPADGSG